MADKGSTEIPPRAPEEEEMSDDGEPVLGRETIKKESEAMVQLMENGGLVVEGIHIDNDKLKPPAEEQFKPPKRLPPLNAPLNETLS
mmetsp:Transcript_116845/g.202779  ORF Transcript_116845/g.202779 Transcript_116845/m.202779 type:complete len:87 (-) Transcript_116845:186-446(-)